MKILKQMWYNGTMNSCVAKKQSISDLSYQLISGKANLEPLQILDARSFEWNGYEVTLQILGASSSLTLKRQDFEVCEVISCAPNLVEAEEVIGLLEQIENETVVSNLENLSIECAFHSYELKSRLKLQLPSTNSFEYAFPTTENGTLPFTYLAWVAGESELKVETVHTYPNQGLGLHSLTRVTVRTSKA